MCTFAVKTTACATLTGGWSEVNVTLVKGIHDSINKVLISYKSNITTENVNVFIIIVSSVGSVITLTALCISFLCCLVLFLKFKLTLKVRAFSRSRRYNKNRRCSDRVSHAMSTTATYAGTLEKVNSHYSSTYLHPPASALCTCEEEVETKMYSESNRVQPYEDVDLQSHSYQESTVNIHYAHHMNIYNSENSLNNF